MEIFYQAHKLHWRYCILWSKFHDWPYCIDPKTLFCSVLCFFVHHFWYASVVQAQHTWKRLCFRLMKPGANWKELEIGTRIWEIPHSKINFFPLLALLSWGFVSLPGSLKKHSSFLRLQLASWDMAKNMMLNEMKALHYETVGDQAKDSPSPMATCLCLKTLLPSFTLAIAITMHT